MKILIHSCCSVANSLHHSWIGQLSRCCLSFSISIYFHHFHRRTQEHCNCVGRVQAKACANRECATALPMFGLVISPCGRSLPRQTIISGMNLCGLLWICGFMLIILMIISLHVMICDHPLERIEMDRDAGCKTRTEDL